MSIPRKRIGIMGGTFNPIHLGHLIIAENAFQEFELDKVLFMPSGVPYQKDASELLPAKQRVQMISLAIEDNKHFELSTIEVERQGNTYTSETLTYLNTTYLNTDFFFIIGADNLCGIEKWHDVETIFSLCTILVGNRNNISIAEIRLQIEYYRVKYNADIKILATPNIDISSRMIRENIVAGKSIKYFVADEVEEYMKKNKFYKGE